MKNKMLVVFASMSPGPVGGALIFLTAIVGFLLIDDRFNELGIFLVIVWLYLHSSARLLILRSKLVVLSICLLVFTIVVWHFPLSTRDCHLGLLMIAAGSLGLYADRVFKRHFVG